MATARQRKRQAAKRRLEQTRKKSPKRPTPLQAVELIHAKQARMLAARSDRFSQLLSRLIKDEPLGQYLLTRSNLPSEEWKELQALAPEANAAFRIELDEAMKALRSFLTLGDPLYIATMIQLSNLFGTWGSYYEPTHEGSEAKVELVVGLLATQPGAVISDAPTESEMQQIHDELDHIVELLFLFNLSKQRGDDVDVAALQFMGVMQWMYMRGSSFGNHGQDLARKLYGPYDDWMLATFGFTVNDVIDIGDAATALINTRVNELKDQAGGFADEALKYLRSGSQSSQMPSDIKELLGTKQGRLQLRLRAFISAVQAGVREALTFSAADICEANESLRQVQVEAALRELSIAVGSLSQSAYSGLFDASPFVERPFLEFNGRYLLAIPGKVLRDTVAILEDRLMTKKVGFSMARAKTLDRLAVKYLSDVLPGSITYTNLAYEGSELDGLVLFEDIAFVIEGKGTGLSVQGHRGDIKRLKNDIGKAVEDAWYQGARAREFLLRGGDSVFRDKSGTEIRISAGSVREVFIINPTLHELGGHAPQLSRLRALGLFPDAELPWSVYINDLRVIAETCDNAAVFLHYLVWRSRLPLGERITVFDEIDLWANFLLCERFGMLEGDGKTLVGNSTTDFDAYYNGLVGHGPQQKPPNKFLCEPVGAFIQRMADERPAGWRDAAGACLDLSLPELAYICRFAKDLVRRATQEGKPSWVNIDRVSAVGIPRKADSAAVVNGHYPPEGDPTFVIFCREGSANRAEVFWARSVKAVTFELSDFEKAAFNVASATDASRTRNR